MTFKFSDHSKAQRQTLHEDLRLICDRVLEFHDFRIDIGFRDEAAQNAAFAAGKSKLRFPQSKHNKTPSEAMDLLPFVNGKFIGWNDLAQWRYFGGIVLGVAFMLNRSGDIGHTLRWGGDWNGDHDMSNQRFNDLPHYELLTPKKG